LPMVQNFVRRVILAVSIMGAVLGIVGLLVYVALIVKGFM
jgi:hypothetical protein